MDNTQLYLAIGLPVFAVMMGILASTVQITAINARMTSLETSLGTRMTSLETTVSARFSSLESRFDTLVGKVVQIDNRLTRVEALLER
ncbi:MAG: hypothetical protein ABSB15_22255 [Bryobacteraceae bacterium]|jgi:hypothetical protein